MNMTIGDVTRIRDAAMSIKSERVCIKVWGDDYGAHIWDKYRNEYNDDFWKLWSYLDTRNAKALVDYANSLSIYTR